MSSNVQTLAPDGQRIQSVDLLRGAVMVLMVIDHVRVYSGIPPGGPDAGVFFTRWVTHFCAPAFAFYVGTSAFLNEQKLKDKSRLAKFLIIRGLLLVILELTIIRFLWAFHVDYSEFVLAGVIWMLGWCMVMLAAFIWLKPWWAALLGFIIIFRQSTLAKVPYLFPESMHETVSSFWAYFYPTGVEPMGGIAVLYVLIPWIGVMAIGYGFGALLRLEEARVKRLCWIIGGSAIALFIIWGSTEILVSPSDEAPPFVFRLLNQSKYPPSPLYLLMTLGPIILLTPWAEKARGWFSDVLTTIGKVPFFFYLLHILIIHLTALVVQLIQTGTIHSEWFSTAPFTSVPEEFRWNLWWLYVVFVTDTVILYFACRWFVGYRASHAKLTWLKYI